jgi:hypothetical protein
VLSREHFLHMSCTNMGISPLLNHHFKMVYTKYEERLAYYHCRATDAVKTTILIWQCVRKYFRVATVSCAPQCHIEIPARHILLHQTDVLSLYRIQIVSPIRVEEGKIKGKWKENHKLKYNEWLGLLALLKEVINNNALWSRIGCANESLTDVSTWDAMATLFDRKFLFFRPSGILIIKLWVLPSFFGLCSNSKPTLWTGHTLRI